MSDVGALQSLLQKEVELLTELNSLSRLKKEALLNDDLASLETIVLKEEILSGNLKTVDNACSSQVQFFLKGQVEPPPEIDALMTELRDLVREVKSNNDFNQALIRDSLSIIQFTLNALLGSDDTGRGVYSAKGKSTQPLQNKSLLDCKR